MTMGVDLLAKENERLRAQVKGHCDRIVAQSELLSKKAERKHGLPAYFKLLEEMADLHEKKARDYGSDHDPLANIRASMEIGVEPWKGAWLRAKDKVKRIDQFCLKGELANEGVEDSLMDIAAYSLIALLLFREQSWVGEGPMTD